MAIVKDKPAELKPVNDLDNIHDPDQPAEPAYLSFGTSPGAIENPPDIDDTRTYIVMVRCTGKSEKERTDGEMRHGRQLTIQACWEQGKKRPAADDEPQPALFDHDGEPSGDEPQSVGEVIDGMTTDELSSVRPPFSDDGK